MNYSLAEELIEYIFAKVKYSVWPSKDNNYTSKFLQSRILLFCVVLLLVLKIITVTISINFPQNIFFADITKIALQNLANQVRQSSGLQPLAENYKLEQAAQLKAHNMVINNYFAHTSPQGITPWYWFLQAGYDYKYAGENLAIGFFESEEVFQAWMDSPSHKANILNPNYKEIGTAVMSGYGGNNTIVVVQEFGSQLQAKTTVLQTVSKDTTIEQLPAEQIPSEVASTPSTDSITSESVLSQEIQSQSIIEEPHTIGANDLSIKLLNSIIYNYDEWLQNLIFGLALVIIGILLLMIFFNFSIIFKKELVFSAVLLLILLSAATLINNDIVTLIIPHQITI
jgi:hypothetical protein